MKNCRKQLFVPPKWSNGPSKPPKWSHVRPKISIFRVMDYLLNWKYNQKLAFYVKKNTKTLLKQLEKNFKKVQKTAFLTHKMAKKPHKTAKMSVFFTENLIFAGIYQPFELKIQTKVSLLMPNTMFKYFLNKIQKTLKKSRKWFFLTPKLSKNGCRLCRKCRFLDQFSIYGPLFWLVGFFSENRSPN